MKKKELEELIHRYEEAIADNKVPYLDANEYSEIASYYWVEKKDEDAKKAVENGLRIHPGNDDILRIQIEFLIDDGDLDEAREIMDNLQSHPSMEIQYLNAELYYEEGDSEKALSILDKLFEINTDADVFINMAELYSDMDEKERALECLKIADRISPENQEIYQQLVNVLTELKKFEEATVFCNKIIDENPYSFFAWVKLAECYSALAKYDKTIEAAEFAMIASAESALPYFIRGQAFLTLENYERALQDMLYILDASMIPSQYLYYYIGICYLNLENYADALENLKMAEDTLTETDVTLYYNVITDIVECLYKLERYEEGRMYEQLLPSAVEIENKSIEDLEHQATLEPSAQNYYNLGIRYLENKFFEKAVATLKQVQLLDPTLKGIGLKLLLAYIGKGDKKEIREYIRSISDNMKKTNSTFKVEIAEDQIDQIIDKMHKIFTLFLDSANPKDEDYGSDNDSDIN